MAKFAKKFFKILLFISSYVNHFLYHISSENSSLFSLLSYNLILLQISIVVHDNEICFGTIKIIFFHLAKLGD